MLLIVMFAPLSCFAAKSIDIAVMTVLPDEAYSLQKAMHDKQVLYLNHDRYVIGDIDHHHVLLNVTGAGSVNTVISAMLIMHQFDPTYYVLSGVAAGSDNSHVGDVVLGKNVFDFDTGRQVLALPEHPFNHLNPIRKQSETVKFTANSQLLYTAQKGAKSLQLNATAMNGKTVTAKIISGNLAGTDGFPFSTFDFERMQLTHVQAINMEDAAFMKFCWVFSRKCLAIRSISHVQLHDDTHYTKWSTANEKTASQNAAKVTLALIKNL